MKRQINKLWIQQELPELQLQLFVLWLSWFLAVTREALFMNYYGQQIKGFSADSINR